VGLLAISSEVERPLWPNFAVKSRRYPANFG
jgi:hypothetical protein